MRHTRHVGAGGTRPKGSIMTDLGQSNLADDAVMAHATSVGSVLWWYDPILEEFMPGEGFEDLAQAQARLDWAHQQVTRGGYGEAVVAFRAVLAWLEQHQPDHCLVEDVRLDLNTVQDMAAVSGFGRDMGFKNWDPAGDSPVDS